MGFKHLKVVLLALPLGLLLSGAADAARISKSSPRVFRPAVDPALTVVADFDVDAASTTKLNWRWSTAAYTGSGLAGYKLYTSSAATVIALPLGTSYYIDSGLQENKAYTRWITVSNGPDESSDSQHLQKFTFAVPPSSFTYANVTASSVYLEWHYSSATAYAVEHSTDGGLSFLRNRAVFVPWQTLVVPSNRNLIVRIGGLNGDDELTPGFYSLSITTVTPPLDVPLDAVTYSSYTIEWRWNADQFAGSDITAFRLYKSSTSESGDIDADDAGGVLKTLTPGTSYWLEVIQSSAGAYTGDTRHARWMKAVGLLESVNRSVKNKYTYAVAPDTCSVMEPGTLNIDQTDMTIAWPGGKLASKYLLEMSTSADFAVSLTSFPAESGLSYHVTGLTPNTKYDFRVGAVNGDGEKTPANALNPEAYSDIYKVITRPPPPTSSCDPITDTRIQLSWSTGPYIGMNYITGYFVSTPVYHPELSMFLNHAISPWLTDLTIGSYGQEYMLTNSTHTMGIWVTQASAGYDTYGSKVINYLCSTFATPPNDVSFDTVTARTASLWWRHAEVPATSYRIERATSVGEGGPWVFVSTAAGNRHIDSGLSPSTTYAYRIGAVNLMGLQTLGMAAATGGFRRDYSYVSSTITKHVSPVLTGVVYGSSTISWNWTDPAAGVLSYNIYTSSYGLLAAGLPAGTTFWLETGLPAANTLYTRDIASLKATGLGELNESGAITQAAAPAALAAAATGLHTITLGWNGNGGTRYRLDRSQDLASWTTLKSWSDALTTQSYTDTALHAAATYYYAVLAYNQDGVLTVSSATSPAIRTLDLPAGLTQVFSTATAALALNAPLPGLGTITLTLPAGSVTADNYVSVSTSAGTVPVEVTKTDLDAATAKLSGNSLLPGGIVELRRWDMFGALATASFATPARVLFTYTDATNDGVVDGTAIEEDTLRVFTLDPAALVWNPERNSVIDPVANTVYLDTSHFSIYALGSQVSVVGELGTVFAYPNPYKPGSAGAFGQSVFGEGIVFESMPARAKVKIYSLAGGLVRELTDDDGDGRCLWDARNADGSRAASGVYIYIVSAGGSKKVGRVAIIK
ncbi:MAG: fibronectin type III domain-containing protein [Elusimicrobiales bacterium]|nr:fibronectin type III domain-containing protein [Elusimicrobiales bacterium]